MIKYIKTKIRLLVLYFYIRTMNFITNDLHQRIFENKDNQKELQNVLKEILILKQKYPNEPEITKAETIVTRLLVLKS
jgi:hypothetical protein